MWRCGNTEHRPTFLDAPLKRAWGIFLFFLPFSFSSRCVDIPNEFRYFPFLVLTFYQSASLLSLPLFRSSAVSDIPTRHSVGRSQSGRSRVRGFWPYEEYIVRLLRIRQRVEAEPCLRARTKSMWDEVSLTGKEACMRDGLETHHCTTVTR